MIHQATILYELSILKDIKVVLKPIEDLNL